MRIGARTGWVSTGKIYKTSMTWWRSWARTTTRDLLKRPSSLNDTYLTKQSTEERAFAANKYGSKKDKGYNSTIKKKDLPYGYMSLTFGTFGSFGEGTWRLITKACDPTTHPKAVSDCDPWQLPGPKRDFILPLGFSLQRANSRMIRNADSRRRNARNGRKYASGTRSF